ncbi:hypothetical protein [Alishewanella longhuensis]
MEIRAAGSPYVFPNRRSSKNPHMGADTLNRAITKLFGHEAGEKEATTKQNGRYTALFRTQLTPYHAAPCWRSLGYQDMSPSAA